MKLLTLNTHSLEEADMEKKQEQFVSFIEQEKPEVFALQEVNQLMSSPVVKEIPQTLFPVQDTIPLREDNHALAISKLLSRAGLTYYWAWLPIKVGYSKYDEGLAIFSRLPILEAENLLVSNVNEYSNYRTRRILGIRNQDGWFYDCHMSWWGDPDEPFAGQWKKLLEQLAGKAPIYLLGDFNGDAAIRNENYDLIENSGFYDTFKLARTRDEGWTVSGAIDGWKDQEFADARRIDQIWVNEETPVTSSRVVFNGKTEPVISDHYGIEIEV